MTCFDPDRFLARHFSDLYLPQLSLEFKSQSVVCAVFIKRKENVMSKKVRVPFYEFSGLNLQSIIVSKAMDVKLLMILQNRPSP